MPAYDQRSLGPAPRDPSQKYWDPAAQTMPREQLRELQLDRLRELVDELLAGKAPLFGRKLTEAGITAAGDIRSIDDVNQIPTTVKQELRDSEAEHPPSANTASHLARIASVSVRRREPPAGRRSRCGHGATSGSSTSRLRVHGGATAGGPGRS